MAGAPRLAAALPDRSEDPRRGDGAAQPERAAAAAEEGSGSTGTPAAASPAGAPKGAPAAAAAVHGSISSSPTSPAGESTVRVSAGPTKPAAAEGSAVAQAPARSAATVGPARAEGTREAVEGVHGAPPAPTQGVAAGEAPASAGAAGGGPQAEGPLLSAGVRLSQIIESLGASVEIAQRPGLARARISLDPAGLGQIRVHLSQTASGLLVRLTATAGAASEALAASRGELEQALQSLQGGLLRLDLGHSGEQRREAGQARGGRGGGSASGRGESIDSPAAADGAPEALPARRGVLVDVTA